MNGLNAPKQFRFFLVRVVRRREEHPSFSSSPTVTGWSPTVDEFSLLFDNNPLAEFVELPDSCYNLRYSNILCGAIKGALEMVHIEVLCWFVQDTLKGDNVTELRVKFIRKIEDSVPPGDD